jgi:tRNA G26 N,N-dimethylase Trm1
MAVGTVERAFQLAPECTSIEEIRRKLKREGHSAVDEHLQGSSVQTDLKKLLNRG